LPRSIGAPPAHLLLVISDAYGGNVVVADHGAQILLKADVDGPNWTDARIAEAFQCPVQTIENLRKRLVTEGFEAALNGKLRESPPTPPLLDGQGEAKLIALRLGKPPGRYGRWTLQLLADELVALEVVDSISIETVRQTLKKTE
jgi:hypothetical protein